MTAEKVIDNKVIILQKNAGYYLEHVVVLWYAKRKEIFMTELIKIQYGRVVSVEPRNPSVISQAWNWRKEFEGFCGVMHIYQSQRKNPGKHFIVIYDIEQNHLKTSAGDLTDNGNRITLTTKNSIYTFECIEIKRKDGN